MLRCNTDGAKLALLDRSTPGRVLARLRPRKFAKISQRRAHEKNQRYRVDADTAARSTITTPAGCLPFPERSARAYPH